MKDDFIKIADECLGKQEKWDEEFEDIVFLTKPTKTPWGLYLFGRQIKNLFDKYFKLTAVGTSNTNLESSVKIKARKGIILIEEVK